VLAGLAKAQEAPLCIQHIQIPINKADAKLKCRRRACLSRAANLLYDLQIDLKCSRPDLLLTGRMQQPAGRSSQQDRPPEEPWTRGQHWRRWWGAARAWSLGKKIRRRACCCVKMGGGSGAGKRLAEREREGRIVARVWGYNGVKTLRARAIREALSPFHVI